MRHVLLVLLVVGVGAAIAFALLGHPSPSGDAAVASVAPQPGQRARTSARPVTKGPAQLVSPALVAAPAPGVAAPNGARSLDGTLVDRFDSPVAGERVFLVPGEGGHPPANAQLSDYVTATTSSDGRFSLTLPGDGPWRLAVGPPGAPRIPVSEPRAMTASTRADVIVPGAAVLRVTFDEPPAEDEPTWLEVVSLREPEAPEAPEAEAEGAGRPGGLDRGRRRGERDRGDRQGAGSGEDAGAERGGRRGGGRGGRDGGTGGRDGGQPEEARDGLVRGPLGVVGIGPAAALGQDAQGEAAGGRQRGQRANRRSGGQEQQQGQERGQEQQAEAESDEPYAGPPPEVWHRLHGHRLAAAERAAGVVELSGLPVGPICRLVLVVGGQRIEGSGRFTLQPDTLVEVRVFPFEVDASSSLNYVAVPRRLAAGERPAGVHWSDSSDSSD